MPSSSPFASINGLIHINCLRTHPQKKEIQNELTRIYLQIFGNHPDFPIVAQADCILIKSRPDHEILEIYDFEDFVEFYIPYNQIEEFMKMNGEQKLDIGVNKWTSLVVNNVDQLKLVYRLIKEDTLDIIELPFLSLSKLKDLVFEASTKIKFIKDR